MLNISIIIGKHLTDSFCTWKFKESLSGCLLGPLNPVSLVPHRMFSQGLFPTIFGVCNSFPGRGHSGTFTLFVISCIQHFLLREKGGKESPRKHPFGNTSQRQGCNGIHLHQAVPSRVLPSQKFGESHQPITLMDANASHILNAARSLR